MGKALIIKGADFGAVAVTAETIVPANRWLLGFSDEVISKAAQGSAFFQPDYPENIAYVFGSGADSALIGKTVKKIKFYATGNGTLKLCRFDRTNYTLDCIQTLTVTETGVVTMNLTTHIQVDSTHTIGIMYTNNAATKYLTNTAYGYPFAMADTSAKTVGTAACAFTIDYAY